MSPLVLQQLWQLLSLASQDLQSQKYNNRTNCHGLQVRQLVIFQSKYLVYTPIQEAPVKCHSPQDRGELAHLVLRIVLCQMNCDMRTDETCPSSHKYDFWNVLLCTLHHRSTSTNLDTTVPGYLESTESQLMWCWRAPMEAKETFLRIKEGDQWRLVPVKLLRFKPRNRARGESLLRDRANSCVSSPAERMGLSTPLSSFQ